MSKETLDLLKILSATPGPVGREEMVQDIVKEHFKQHCGDYTQDRIGNVVGTLEGGVDRHYALVAHADEVGFLVSNIDERGFLKVKWNTQGHMPDLRLLPGQWVLIMAENGLIPGVFCVQTAHIAGPEGKKRIPTYEEIFLDIGAKNSDEVKEHGINIGNPVIYAAPVEKLMGNIVAGKSMDDRIGLTVMLRVLEHFSKIAKAKRPTVTFVSTVMEELGAKGASVVAKDLDVDELIILDIGLADDYPGTKGEAGVSLGKGPVVVIKDNAMHYSHELVQRIIKTAEKEKIPIQRAVFHNFMTDGSVFASQGQVVAVLAVPCRYSHSAFEAVSLLDVDMTIQLLMKLFA
ncbi:MAG: M42 family metallopeptidase [Candidatus Thorarchaeota archaeon]|jgi:endoglucanase